MHNLTPISKNDIDSMSNNALCERMDAVLYNILCESYSDPDVIEKFPRQSIKDFFNTKKIQSLSQTNQRTALRKCFEYLAQHEYLSRISGWLNEAVFGVNYDENQSWLSPRIQSISCTSNHIKIIGSVVAFERMMDLLHIIDTGEPLSGKQETVNKIV